MIADSWLTSSNFEQITAEQLSCDVNDLAFMGH
jgi:hypothetical protein